MFSPGGIILTLMPKKFWHRNLFDHGLYFYQRLLLWLRYRKLEKLQKQTLARIKHIQLDLGPVDKPGAHLFLNVTFPEAKFEVYGFIRLQNESDESYAKPLFEIPSQYIPKMRSFAKELVTTRKRSYDWLQLFSYFLNIIIWMIKPSTWGKEVNHMLNLPGGKQVCSSGTTSCLRYIEVGPVTQSLKKSTFDTQQFGENVKIISSRGTTRFFKGYDTAMVSPVLFLLEGKWETPGEIYQIDKSS